MFDGDGDGWGDPNAPEYGISGSDCDDNDASLNKTDRDGDGFTTCNGDCNDDRINVYPGAAELESAVLCMKDTDQDGYGDSNPPEGITAGSDCNDSSEILNANDSDGDGYTTCSGDCDENDA